MAGTRFSHNYLNQGDPSRDSSRMRERLGQFMYKNVPGLPRFLRTELGVEVDSYDNWLRPDFWRTVALRDVLDAITITYNFLGASQRAEADQWRATVRRVFREENVGYRMDDDGSVHYLVDATFEAARKEVVSGLGHSRYRNVLLEFDRGIAELDGDPQNPKGAIRGVFSAIEGMFRLMFDKAPRLGAGEIDQHLKPLIVGELKDNKVAAHAAAKLLRSFGEWVDAAHFYRHEAGHEEPLQPPMELAVMLISEGVAILRWLISVDAKLSK